MKIAEIKIKDFTWEIYQTSDYQNFIIKNNEGHLMTFVTLMAAFIYIINY